MEKAVSDKVTANLGSCAESDPLEESGNRKAANRVISGRLHSMP
jgi:hypothetical protein